ncbi:MAG: rhodanese-like domain-containing protein [Mycobacterium sp.]
MYTAALGAASCGQDQIETEEPASAIATRPAAHRLLGPNDFADAIVEPARITVNVHVPYEGEIPGTDLSIPFDQIAQQAVKLPLDRDTPLAIYCRSGPMSAQAAAELGRLGYADVVELDGGMRSWQESGRPLVNG